jgi:hypothetical protein
MNISLLLFQECIYLLNEVIDHKQDSFINSMLPKFYVRFGDIGLKGLIGYIQNNIDDDDCITKENSDIIINDLFNCCAPNYNPITLQ